MEGEQRGLLCAEDQKHNKDAPRSGTHMSTAGAAPATYSA